MRVYLLFLIFLIGALIAQRCYTKPVDIYDSTNKDKVDIQYIYECKYNECPGDSEILSEDE